MKWNEIINKIVLSISLLFIISGCENKITYEPVWDPDKQGAPDPVIYSIQPDSALGGVMEINLFGENFAPEIDQNFVYFNGNSAVVKTASATQLTVIRPISLSGLVTIRLSVRDAYKSVKFDQPYKLEGGVVEVGEELGRVYSIAIDSSENLYVHRMNDKKIYKITPDGAQSEYGTFTEASTSSAMRMGPGGYLYLQRSTGTGDGFKRLYRIAPGGGEAERFVKLSRNVKSFDFDQNGNIYSGGINSGMFVIHSDKTFKKVGNYLDFDIRAIRVFKGYVYVAAGYNGTDTLLSSDSTTVIVLPAERGIWKSQILNEGNLATAEPVFNWANSGSFSTSEINDITFSEEGDMYVATNNSDPILIIHSDGTTETLYEKLLSGPAAHLVWGNGNYIYINRYGENDDVSGVDRVIMGKQGAPYYGRD